MTAHGMFRLLATVCALLALALPAVAREEIRSFTAAVTVLPNGSVDVTETIVVNAEGTEIRRGIFRDIFTTLINDDNSRLRSTLNVISVFRDGRVEPYTTSSISNGVEIRIGDPDVFLPEGEHEYRIRYTMSRMVRHFPDHDELFWNVTGNYWNFPILRASATVRLPDGAVISDLVVYTGQPGSRESEATARRISDTQASFTTTDVLEPTSGDRAGEGMSVAVGFQKGVVAEPTGTQRILYWFSDHRDLLLPGFAVFIVLLYNYFAWDAVGRDPNKGVIIPLFHPPKGLSPALLHYIHEMGWTKGGWTAFTASIFDLGVKGLVQIEQSGKTLTITATGKQPEGKLSQGERVLLDYFTAQGRTKIDTTNGPKINTKRGEMIAAIEAENRQVYFKNNTGYVVVGAALSAVLLAALVLLGVLDIVWLIVSIVVGVALGLLTSAFHRLWDGGSGFRRYVVVVWVAIFAFNALGNLINWGNLFTVSTGMMAAISIVLICIGFAILLRAPTVAGRRLMDQIEGFRMYLDTAEKERLNMQGEPPMTVTRFESILPYAIALGVEKPWSEHFEGELARHAVQDAEDGSYRPRWHSSRDFSSSSSGGFSNAVSAATSGMSAAMISAQPASSSSSGFSGGGGGGGGSGGGGGGGGGGGW